MNNIIQGMGLDPNLVDKFHQNHPGLAGESIAANAAGQYDSPERISHQQQQQSNTEPSKRTLASRGNRMKTPQRENNRKAMANNHEMS